MKKALATLLTAIMVLTTITGCGGSEADSPAGGSEGCRRRGDGIHMAGRP